jgi:hypothetical protein
MQCKELQAVLADDELNALSREAREHLTGCPDCQGLLADFSAILAAAKTIPAEVNPPQRVWVALQAQMEAEGMLRDAQPVEAIPARSGWSGIAAFFRPRVLATIGAAVFVAAGAVYIAQRPGTQTSVPVAAVPTANANAADTVKPGTPVEATAVQPPPVLTSPKHRGVAETARLITPPVPRESKGELAPSPSETAYFGDSAAVLSETENNLPTRRVAENAAVEAALHENLHTLNEFIAECESRLKQNPRDQLTREYLRMAYQQKAELLNAMMDSGRSEH